MAEERVRGPASYFPFSENKYGRPISEWRALVRQHYAAKHLELVTMLKSDHGMGRGQANALLAHTLAQDER